MVSKLFNINSDIKDPPKRESLNQNQSINNQNLIASRRQSETSNTFMAHGARAMGISIKENLVLGCSNSQIFY